MSGQIALQATVIVVAALVISGYIDSNYGQQLCITISLVQVFMAVPDQAFEVLSNTVLLKFGPPREPDFKTTEEELEVNRELASITLKERLSAVSTVLKSVKSITPTLKQGKPALILVEIIVREQLLKSLKTLDIGGLAVLFEDIFNCQAVQNALKQEIESVPEISLSVEALLANKWHTSVHMRNGLYHLYKIRDILDHKSDLLKKDEPAQDTTVHGTVFGSLCSTTPEQSCVCHSSHQAEMNSLELDNLHGQNLRQHLYGHLRQDPLVSTPLIKNQDNFFDMMDDIPASNYVINPGYVLRWPLEHPTSIFVQADLGFYFDQNYMQADTGFVASQVHSNLNVQEEFDSSQKIESEIVVEMQSSTKFNLKDDVLHELPPVTDSSSSTFNSTSSGENTVYRVDKSFKSLLTRVFVQIDKETLDGIGEKLMAALPEALTSLADDVPEVLKSNATMMELEAEEHKTRRKKELCDGAENKEESNLMENPIDFSSARCDSISSYHAIVSPQPVDEEGKTQVLSWIQCDWILFGASLFLALASIFVLSALINTSCVCSSSEPVAGQAS